MATLEELGAAGSTASSTKGMCLQQGICSHSPLRPWEIMWQVPCLRTGGGRTFWPHGRDKLRLTIAQACVRRHLAHFPWLLRGKQAVRARSGGAEGRRRAREIEEVKGTARGKAEAVHPPENMV